MCARHAIIQNLSVILKTILLLGNYKELARMGSFWTWKVLWKFSTMCSCNSIFYKKGAYIMKKKERKKSKNSRQGKVLWYEINALISGKCSDWKMKPYYLDFCLYCPFPSKSSGFLKFCFWYLSCKEVMLVKKIRGKS